MGFKVLELNRDFSPSISPKNCSSVSGLQRQVWSVTHLLSVVLGSPVLQLSVEMALGTWNWDQLPEGTSLAVLLHHGCSWKPAPRCGQALGPAPAKPASEMLLWRAEILQITLTYKKQHLVNLLNADPAPPCHGKS